MSSGTAVQNRVPCHKMFPVHAVKAEGSRGTAPIILDLDLRGVIG